MPVDVGEDRRDAATLRGPVFRVPYLPVSVQYAGFQPLANEVEEGPIIDPQAE